MKKLVGILLILAAIAGIAYLYYSAGILEQIKNAGKEEAAPVDFAIGFKKLGDEFPKNILILMGSIGAFLYSFKWFAARKAPKLPRVKKTGDPEADKRAQRRRETAMAAQSQVGPRMPGALMMNSYFMITAVAVLVVAAGQSLGGETAGAIALVLALQLAVGILFMLFALVWEKSLFHPGSLLGMFVHFSVIAGVAVSVIRHWEPPQ